MLTVVSSLFLANLLEASVTDGEAFRMRLKGGQDRCSGRVEVQHEGKWGTVCEDRRLSNFSIWSMEEADVVCRELGCPGAVAALRKACFNLGNGHIWLGLVNCLGNERYLHQCRNNGFGPQNCSHHGDVGVVCADLRTMVAPSLFLESSSEVHAGQSFRMHCQVPRRSCCIFTVQLSHNGDYISYTNIKSEQGFAKFTVSNVQAWHAGDYRCQYSYQGVPQASPGSNNITITVDAVPVWVVPVCATVGGVLLLILLVVTVYCIVKRQRSNYSAM